MEQGQTYTLEDLRIMQARPPERKVLITYTRLLELCLKVDYKIAVSFSGGKDSTVLLDMVGRFWAGEKERHGGAPLVVVFANTSNEFMGMEKFVKEYCKYIEEKHGIVIDLHIVRGEKTFYEVIKDIGYPIGSKRTAKQVRKIRKWLRESGVCWDDVKDRLDNGIESADYMRSLGAPDTIVLYLTGIKSDNKDAKRFKLSIRWRPLIVAPFECSEECCEKLKKAPIRTIEKELELNPIIAEMADDGEQRKAAYLKTGCNAFKGGKARSKPMGPWVEQDVLWYIDHYKLPYFHVYGDLLKDEKTGLLHFIGEQRTGCKLCLFGCQFNDAKEKFVRIAKMEPPTLKFALSPLEENGLGYRAVLEYINSKCKCKIVIPEPEKGAAEVQK